MAVEQDITVYWGTDNELAFTVEGTGSLASWEVVFTVRKRDRPTAPRVFEVDATIPDPAARVLLVSIPREKLLTLTPEGKPFAYDLSRVNPGFDTVLSKGAFVIAPRVTDAADLEP